MWGPLGPLAAAAVADENREHAESKLMGPCRCGCYCRNEATVVWNEGAKYLAVCQECHDDREMALVPWQ
jgi:hypothetical protein